MASKILLVEDDQRIGASLAEALGLQGHEVDWQRTGHGALQAVDDFTPDVVILDLGLPDIDGVEVCRRLRQAHPTLAIVVVTARSDEVDAVIALDAGADDYVSKPFRIAELLARLRSQERRLGRMVSTGSVRAGDVEVDRSARRVAVSGRELNLSRKEFDLLALLVEEAGRVVTREHIIDIVWDEHWFGSTKTLDMHIVGLRRKLAETGVTTARITTLRGVGYRLDVR